MKHKLQLPTTTWCIMHMSNYVKLRILQSVVSLHVQIRLSVTGKNLTKGYFTCDLIEENWWLAFHAYFRLIDLSYTCAWYTYHINSGYDPTLQPKNEVSHGLWWTTSWWKIADWLIEIWWDILCYCSCSPFDYLGFRQFTENFQVYFAIFVQFFQTDIRATSEISYL